MQIRDRSYDSTERDDHAAQIMNRCRYYTWRHNAYKFNENMVEENLTWFRKNTVQPAMMDRRLFL